MAEKWYPIIDELRCNRCGICIDKCKNGVYNKEAYPKPEVISPIHCCDGCHGCENLCPSGAITYANDETGRIPPHKK